jgi:hypothetical protein
MGLCQHAFITRIRHGGGQVEESRQISVPACAERMDFGDERNLAI